jgi:putative FmdB family regulatory protein
MPLYEYRCRGCGERFEMLQRLGEDGHGLLCPRCGEREPERVLSTFAAHGGGDGGSRAMSDAGGCCRGPGFS